MEYDEQLLKNRIEDLAERADRQRIWTHSAFLSPQEQDLFLRIQKKLPVPSHLYGGAESCIRKLAVFGSEEEFGFPFPDPVRVLHVRPRAERFAAACSHRDYLGAMMALGIDRKLTGDILVREKEAWIFVLDTASAFLAENLTSVGRTQTVCEEQAGGIPEIAPRFLQLPVNIASERLDLLLAAAAGLKREDAKKLLLAERVFVNGRTAVSPGQKLRPGDELVIRGHGKYIFDGISGVTKKGRLNAVLRKYL